MNSVFNRRAAIRGAVVLAAGAATPTGAEIAAAADFPQLSWQAQVPSIGGQKMRSRIISGVPATVDYGKPVALGPVIVQVLTEDTMGRVARAAGYGAVSGTVTASVVVTDARGLSGRFPITIEFPRTDLATGLVESVITGTATLTGSTTLPLPRNPGPMTIAIDPSATGAMAAYKLVVGAPPTLFNSRIMLYPQTQNPLVATIVVR